MLGSSDIADLRLTRLQKLIERFTMSPNLLMMSLFGVDSWESDNIDWESYIGNRGLTPFVAPDAKSPMTSPAGVAKHSAMAATWKEKMFFGETFLNNLRQPGTREKYLPAKKRLAMEMRSLRNRCDRRKEWMLAKMLTAGSITYQQVNGVIFTVSYGIPSQNLVTLAASRMWDDGESRNIVEDIMDSKITMSNNNSGTIDYAMFTSEILKLMILDPAIQTLLQKSAFGAGNLMSAPVQVLGSLLHIPNMVLYDEQYQIRGYMTANVTGGSTTSIAVDDASDFEVGGTLRFYDVSANTYEDETISAVDPQAQTVTVATAPTASFKSNEDFVAMTKKFLPTDKFTMFCSVIEGQKIAEFGAAPYGLDRKWGMQVDTHDVWDPDGTYIRVQNKGLPVLYQEDGVYSLTVKD